MAAMPEKARHYEGVRREVGLGVALPEGEHHDSNRQDDHDTSIRSESRRRSSHDFRAPVPVTTGRFARFRLRSFPSGEPVPSCVLLDAGVHRLLRDSELAADFAIGGALFNAEPITLGHAIQQHNRGNRGHIKVSTEPGQLQNCQVSGNGERV